MELTHRVNLRLNKAEFRHIEKLSKKHGSLTQGLRELIQRDMSTNANANHGLEKEDFSIRVFYLLKALMKDFYVDKNDVKAIFSKADAAALEIINGF